MLDPSIVSTTSTSHNDWPVRASEVGEIYGAARQLRDPAIYVEKAAGGKDQLTLFYTVCGEQGIAAADIEIGKP